MILAAAAIAVWPLVTAGPSCGSDFSFHFVSWIEARRSLLEGIVYPHWASGPNFGAGEPRFMFYPPLTWMAGGLLGLVVPWRAVSTVLVYLLLAATGLANRALARQVVGDGPATLAGCASIFLGNMLADVYMRSDYAELAGGFWIPLLLLFQLRRNAPSGTLLQRMPDGLAPLAIVIAGIWLTNGPLGIMASYLLAATALVSAALEKSWIPFARAAIAAVVGGALASIYLVPAIWERGWASIGSALNDSKYVVENGWLFGHHADPGWSDYDTSVDIHSWIAVAMFGIFAAAVWLAWRRGKLKAERAWWIPLALVPVAVLLMQLPISAPLWKWLPALRHLQFPWRWLVVMNTPMAVFLGAAAWVNPRRGRIPLVAACALASFLITGATWGICNQDCRNIVSATPLVEGSKGTRGKPEYAPPGIRHAQVEPDVAGNCVVRQPWRSDWRDRAESEGRARRQRRGVQRALPADVEPAGAQSIHGIRGPCGLPDLAFEELPGVARDGEWERRRCSARRGIRADGRANSRGPGDGDSGLDGDARRLGGPSAQRTRVGHAFCALCGETQVLPAAVIANWPRWTRSG